MSVEKAVNEVGSAVGTVATGVFDGAVQGASTAARGVVNAGRKTLEVATNFSDPASENFVLLGMKALIGGALEFGGSIVSGGINALATAAKYIPGALGYLGNGVVELFTPSKKDPASKTSLTSSKPHTGLPPGGFKPAPTPVVSGSSKGHTII